MNSQPKHSAAPRVLDEDSWRLQLRDSIRDPLALVARFPSVRSLLGGIAAAAERFPMSITPYYAGLIRVPDYSDPIFAQAVPRPDELLDPPWLEADPLGEEEGAPNRHCLHRYRDRLLLLSSPSCFVYCRHCTRKRVAGVSGGAHLDDAGLEDTVRYLKERPEIEDVLVSGGDPLTLSTERLERILRALRSVSSVRVLRIATRAPVVLPMRVDAALAGMLRRYGPVFLNTHFNHPAELTPRAEQALALLADAGIPLGNQTVLLRGVNDSAETLERLFRGLLRNRVRPYYLFQCDLVSGVEHFRTPISAGLEIMRHLRANLDGMAIPHFVLDTPGGGGKVELLPDAGIVFEKERTVLRNPGGDVWEYPEPEVR